MKSTTQKIIGATVIAVGLFFTYITGNAKSFMIYVGLAVGVTIVIAGATQFPMKTICPCSLLITMHLWNIHQPVALQYQ